MGDPVEAPTSNPPPKPKLKPYLCEVCGRSFDRPSSLTSHMNSHTGERPFHCDKCRVKSFTTSSNLYRHQRTCLGPSVGVNFTASTSAGSSSSVRTSPTDRTGTSPRTATRFSSALRPNLSERLDELPPNPFSMNTGSIVRQVELMARRGQQRNGGYADRGPYSELAPTPGPPPLNRPLFNGDGASAAAHSPTSPLDFSYSRLRADVTQLTPANLHPAFGAPELSSSVLHSSDSRFPTTNTTPSATGILPISMRASTPQGWHDSAGPQGSHPPVRAYTVHPHHQPHPAEQPPPLPRQSQPSQGQYLSALLGNEQRAPQGSPLSPISGATPREPAALERSQGRTASGYETYDLHSDLRPPSYENAAHGVDEYSSDANNVRSDRPTRQAEEGGQSSRYGYGGDPT